MALSVDINANTRQAQSQVKDLSKELDKYSDALDDMAKDADRSADKVERSFRDMVKGADKLGDSGRKAGDDFKDGMKRAEEGVEELGDEAKQTAKETAASFDGSFESIVDMAQEVAANAFGGFGPLGIAAGLAAAGGIGLAVKGFEDVALASEESKARAAEWADAYLEAGGRILSSTQIVERTRAILTDSEAYEKAVQNAKNWGVSESTALLAMAGDTNALTEARESLDAKTEELSETNIRNAAATGEGRDALKELEIQVRDGASAYEMLTGEMEEGSKRADVLSESLRLMATHTEGATSVVDEFGDTVVTLPDGKTIYIDAETGMATDKTEAIEAKIYSVQDKTVHISTEIGQAQRDLDNFVHRNNGREIRVRGRMTVDNGGWD